MNTRAIIVDDEKQSRIALCEELSGFGHNIEIVGEADNVRSAVKLIDEKKPSLLFLDINLGDGSGFNVLEQITWKDLKVVFVTAYDQYAIKAFKFNAIDYILKPINSVELQKAIEKVSAQKNIPSSANNLKDLIHNFRNTIQKKIAIPTVRVFLLFRLTRSCAANQIAIIPLFTFLRESVFSPQKHFESLKNY